MATIKEFVHRYKAGESSNGLPARNIIILMDGTWNDEQADADDAVTNIVKMRRLLADDCDEQATRYFRGVGNNEDNGVWGRFREGTFGHGERRIRKFAYATVARLYRPGDHLYIFGFSRGAASARMLASDLAKNGIPNEFEIILKPYANKQTKNIEYGFEELRVINKNTNEVKVDFLGVWDTVYAFGIPMRLLGIPFHKYDLFRDKKIALNIRYAVHVVAIDETRDPFQPALMDHAQGNIHEVWFPGVHSDVGGGYEQDSLGRITLEYMLSMLDSYCSNNYLPPIRYDSIRRDDYTNMKDRTLAFHFHGLGYKKSIRPIEVIYNGNASNKKPKLHKSVEDLQDSSEVFSLQEKGFWGNKEKVLRRIVYNPANVKSLREEYQIVP